MHRIYLPPIKAILVVQIPNLSRMRLPVTTANGGFICNQKASELLFNHERRNKLLTSLLAGNRNRSRPQDTPMSRCSQCIVGLPYHRYHVLTSLRHVGIASPHCHNFWIQEQNHDVLYLSLKRFWNQRQIRCSSRPCRIPIKSTYQGPALHNALSVSIVQSHF
jgi:hypothetical protein